MSANGYGVCAECGMERQLVKPRGTLVTKTHNRWDKVKKRMVLCAGSGFPPRDAKKAAPATVFRNA